MKQPTTTASRLALRHYLQQLWLQRKLSIPALLLPGMGTVLGVYAPPLIIAAAITRFGNNTPSLEQAMPYLVGLAAIWLAGEALWRIAFLLLSKMEARAMQNLYNNALSELAKKDIGFFHSNFSGSLTKKAIGYGRHFESFVDTLFFNISAQLLPIFFAAYILWGFSPWLVVTLITLMGAVVAIIIPLVKQRKKLVDIRETASNKMAGHMADVISNMDAVQAFAHETFERQAHEQNTRDYAQKSLRSWDFHTLRIDMLISPIYVLINVIGLALAITLSSETATIAKVFVTFSYFGNITMTLWQFNRIYRNLENAISEAAQFTQLLLIKSTIIEKPGAPGLQVSRGEIVFDDVDFGYSSKKNELLFKNLRLHIAPGEKLALVGHSGGGKTTITKLLLRFINISRGKLLIDGQNIQDVTLASLRSNIAYVPQEPIMFHRTIRENIRYGRLGASDDEVVAAAQKANAHEFITQLPEGYDTLVGERGVKLSGGQRQRIAIARAILKDARILVLDEATSALDSESEKLIQAALHDLMKDRTTIVVAHRLSTIQKMDRIVVLKQGSIIEQGSHKTLLAKNGTYAKLWAHQSGGFIEE